MADIGFVWDEDKYALVQTNHSVTFAEVVEALSDPLALETSDPQGHLDRCMVVGATAERVLQILYSDDELPLIRVITAFDANSRWRHEYERTN
jgi:uncharacterized DUF497 family protein